MPITVDPDTSSYAWSATLRLAERFSLTVYDAAYLELAQRRILPLATLDRELRAAAPPIGWRWSTSRSGSCRRVRLLRAETAADP